MPHHDRFDSFGDDAGTHLMADDDVTREFWGPGSGWDARAVADAPQRPTRTRRADDTTGAIRAIRDGFDAFRPHVSDTASGEVRRVRQHGLTTGAQPRRDVDEFELIPGSDDVVAWTDDDPIPFGPPTLADRFGLGSVDPFLVRIGVIVVAFVLLIPLAMSLRTDDTGTVTTGSGGMATEVVEQADTTPSSTSLAPAADPAASPVARTDPPEAATQPAPASDPATAALASAPQSEDGGSDGTTVADDTAVIDFDKTSEVESAQARTSGLGDQPATVAALADRIEPNCSSSYIAQAGDSWYAIADAADVTPIELISENRATLETVIAPGDEVCLPAGAAVPTTGPPTTEAPTTDPPAIDPGDETPPEESTPTTTEAPTTTVHEETAPSSTASEVQQIIRDIWPDELEEKALDIAFRESRFDARAYNGWCCYGVFQLYWTVHEGWLDDYGIDSIEDLYDARKNTEAAYAMYQSSGWGPWGG